MQNNKANLRTHFKAQREQLSATVITEKSIAISNQCLALPIWDGEIYHLFLSSEKLKEVDTQPLMSILFGKDKTVVVPKMAGQQELEHYVLTEHTPMKSTPYGIPEPQEGKQLQAQELDVVFVPLLAFDQKGHRVGYGKGYYDRFLKKCKEEVLTVGLSLFDAIEEIEDAQPHDIPLDYVVAPNGAYRFK
jgi:5-formyltetrahydrofolate cyclo-ligase